MSSLLLFTLLVTFTEPYVLIVSTMDENGVYTVTPSGTWKEYGQCVYAAKQLQLFTVNNPESNIMSAGCGECSQMPEYCGGTEL